MAEESTTPDLAELVRTAIEAANSGDFDAWQRVYAPDAVWDASSAGIGIFEGEAAIRSFLEDWIGSYEEFGIRLEENDNLGNGVTFTVVLFDARLRGSTRRLQERWSYASLWEGSAISQTIVRADIDEARAAAGRLATERG